MLHFKQKFDLKTRRTEYNKIQTKYPDYIPVICETDSEDFRDSWLKCKYLVNKNLTIGEFHTVIRKRLKMSPTTALFLFVNNHTFLPINTSFKTIQNNYADIDGFIYINFSPENTFGG